MLKSFHALLYNITLPGSPHPGGSMRNIRNLSVPQKLQFAPFLGHIAVSSDVCGRASPGEFRGLGVPERDCSCKSADMATPAQSSAREVSPI
jgi:hypothetical protein